MLLHSILVGQRGKVRQERGKWVGLLFSISLCFVA